MARKKRIPPRDTQAESRKHVLRERKERRERQLLLSVLGPVLVVVVALIVYGAYRELYVAPRTPVARVAGESIPAQLFRVRVQWYRRQLLNNLQSFLAYAQSSDASFLTDMAEQQRTGAAGATVDQLIDEALVRQEAAKRGITVTEADIDQRIADDLSTRIAPPQATELEATSAPGTGTPVTATVAVTRTATPISTQVIGQEFETTVRPVLDQVGMSVAQYRGIVRQQIFRERLGEAMVPETQKQVEAAYMRFTSQATAGEAASALEHGASWDQVVEAYRSPTPTPAEPTPELGAESSTPAAQGTPAIEVSMATPGAEPSPAASATSVPSPTASATPEPTLAATATAGSEPPLAASQLISPSTGLTEMTGLTEIGAGRSSITPTRGVIVSSGVTVSGGLGGTEVAATATSSVPPTPTATPEPYASDIGEREWMTRNDVTQKWSLSDEDADKVMALGKDEWGGPYAASGNMWYVVYVFDVEEARKIEADRLQTLREQTVTDWLTKQKEETPPDKFSVDEITPPEPDWFVRIWQDLFPEAQPTIDLSTIIAPTALVTTSEPEATLQSSGALTDTGTGP
jgi:hypothetical protein